MIEVPLYRKGLGGCTSVSRLRVFQNNLVRVQGFGFRASGLWFMVHRLWFMVDNAWGKV